MGWHNQYSDCVLDLWSGVQSSVGARDFLFAKLAQTGPKAHPASCNGYISLPGIKQPGYDIDLPPPSDAKCRIE